jgi:hypothetical protein
MKAKKILSISLISLFLLGMSSYITNSVATGTSTSGSGSTTSTTPTTNQNNVTGNKHNQKLTANQTHQFKFTNKFQFSFMGNSSVDMSLECDTEKVGENDFQLALMSSEGLSLKVQCNNSDSNLGLNNGTQVKVQNKAQYQNKNQLTLNISTNATAQFGATLTVKTAEKNATWAYYNETSKEWVPVKTTIQNGVMTAETNHFSVWTILVGDSATTTSETSTVDGFAFIGLVSILGVVLLLRKKNRK